MFSLHVLIFLYQVQRFKQGEETFFELLSKHFRHTKIPQSSLHEEYRKQGPGTCQIWAFKKIVDGEAPPAQKKSKKQKEHAAEGKKDSNAQKSKKRKEVNEKDAKPKKNVREN